jgi:hypothetical protein
MEGRPINAGFTVSHQLVCGKHSVLFDDIRRMIAFVSPQLCHCWNYNDVRNVDYQTRAQFYNKVPRRSWRTHLTHSHAESRGESSGVAWLCSL